MSEHTEVYSYEVCFDSHIKSTLVTDIMRAEKVEWVTYDQIPACASYCAGAIYSSPSDSLLVSVDSVGHWG